jgi:hypothetical protein
MDALDSRFRFYIQYDSKSAFGEEEEEETDDLFSNHPSFASFDRTISINWASYNHLKAILATLEAGLKDPRNQIFHVMSGQDYPIRSAEEIIRFFEENRGKQFMENFRMPAVHWERGGMHRISQWYFYDLFDFKTRIGYYGNRLISKLQNLFGIKRKWPATLPPLYGGGTWWSITRECAAFVVEYGRKNPELLRRMKFTMCPEEMYFHTVIMNSRFAADVVNDHKRYIDWESRNGNSPANLDASDYAKLRTSDKLFARKIGYPVSEELIRLLKSAQ